VRRSVFALFPVHEWKKSTIGHIENISRSQEAAVPFEALRYVYGYLQTGGFDIDEWSSQMLLMISISVLWFKPCGTFRAKGPSVEYS
jgi:hypothetical protein